MKPFHRHAANLIQDRRTLCGEPLVGLRPGSRAKVTCRRCRRSLAKGFRFIHPKSGVKLFWWEPFDLDTTNTGRA